MTTQRTRKTDKETREESHPGRGYAPRPEVPRYNPHFSSGSEWPDMEKMAWAAKGRYYYPASTPRAHSRGEEAEKAEESA